MDETNSNIESNIAEELSAAVAEVSGTAIETSEAPKAEVEPEVQSKETAPEDDKGGKGEENKEFVADDALIERAVKAGLSIEDAKAFKSGEQADRILSKLEEKSVVESKNEEANGSANTEDADLPIKEFEDTLADMEKDGDYSPEFLKMFKNMSAMLKTQAEQIASLKKAGITAEATSFFDKQVSGLGEDVAKHLDAASRSKLEAKFKMLERAYDGDKSMKREDIFKEATTLAISDILAKADAESKAAKLKERRNLTLARPGGEQGNYGKIEQLSTEEGIAATLFEALTK